MAGSERHDSRTADADFGFYSDAGVFPYRLPHADRLRDPLSGVRADEGRSAFAAGQSGGVFSNASVSDGMGAAGSGFFLASLYKGNESRRVPGSFNGYHRRDGDSVYI